MSRHQLLAVFRQVTSSGAITIVALIVAVSAATIRVDSTAGVAAGVVFGLILVTMTVLAAAAWQFQYGASATNASQWRIASAEYVWTIHDLGGVHATLYKNTKGKCLADGVRFIQESGFGDGSTIPDGAANHSGGTIVHVTDARQFSAAIELEHEYNRGDDFNFTFTRSINNGFQDAYEWVSVTTAYYSHTGPLMMEIRFPFGAVVDIAWLEVEVSERRTTTEENRKKTPHTISSSVLKVGQHIFAQVNGEEAGDDRPLIIRKVIESPVPGCSYRIRWKWNGGRGAGASHMAPVHDGS